MERSGPGRALATQVLIKGHGRRMCATAANLIENVLPEVGLRQWVLTFPFAWRRRLAQDGALFGALLRAEAGV